MTIYFTRHLATLLTMSALALASVACGDQSASPTVTPPHAALSPPAGRPMLAFAAGGSIYTVDAAGDAPRTLIPGDRASAWSAAPALSPDGKTLLFTRDYDIWTARADGSDAHGLADVADLMTPPGNSASNWSMGAQEITWSPDGSRVAYLRARIDGSGDSELWTTGADGSDRVKIYESGSFISAAWIKATFIAVNEGDHIVQVETDGTRVEDVALPPESRFGQRAVPMHDNRWLVGSIVMEQPIMVGPDTGMSQIGAGVSATLSPDERRVAYFWHDTLRVMNVDGSHDRQVADLVPLGGRDRHFAEQPECYPQALSACSYRPPSVAWFPNADTSALAVATPISPQRIDATPLVEVTGLFTDPRPTHVDEERSLGQKPAPFAPWDGTSTMLYDTQTGTETNLGPGSLGRFSPDGTKMVWIANPQPPFMDGEARLLDIGTGARRDLGPGRLAVFTDDNRVAIANAGRNDAYVLDLRTGEKRDEPDLGSLFPDTRQTSTPDGYLFDRGASPRGQEWTFTLSDPKSSKTLLRFDASNAGPAGAGSLLAANSQRFTSSPEAGRMQHGTMNLFLVDIPTGRSTFVATTSLDATFAANETYVIWTDDSCTETPGRTKLLSRASGRITELDASLVPMFTSGGLILDGWFGGSALVDPATLQYVTAIPARGDTSWSNDDRYASLGQFPGHGGCGG